MASKDTWVGALPDYDIAPLSNQRVVCAAQREYETGLIVTGARHFDKTMVHVIERIDTLLIQRWARSESGFIDQFGNFLTRQEAWIVADREGQIIRDRDWQTGSLHSEHLY